MNLIKFIEGYIFVWNETDFCFIAYWLKLKTKYSCELIFDYADGTLPYAIPIYTADGKLSYRQKDVGGRKDYASWTKNK